MEMKQESQFESIVKMLHLFNLYAVIMQGTNIMRPFKYIAFNSS